MLIATTAISCSIKAPTISEPKGEVKEIVKTIKPTSIQIKPTTNSIKLYLTEVVTRYGLDYDKFYYTVQHESTFNPNAVGPGGFSIGISQFILGTWLANCSKIDERRNPYKSLDCMGKMFSKGHAYEWDAYCFRFYDEKCVTLRGLYPK